MDKPFDSHAITTLFRVKVPVSDLRIGMYVCELDRPWLDSPFLFQGFALATQADIKAVQEACEYVYVDSYKTKYPETADTQRPIRSSQISWTAASPQKRVSVEQEIDNARNTHKQTSNLVKTFMDEIRFGRGVDIQLAKEAVSECVDSIYKNPDAMLLLTQLKNRDEYTSEHSMNVCIFSIVLGRYMGMPVHELRNLGLSGLMHDMGKMKVPLEILNKPGRLTDAEMALMKAHTVHGRDILMSSRGIYAGAIDVAHGHHENLDGTGYPRGLTDTQISPFTRIIAVADTYDAITSDRVYQPGRTHMEAIGLLNKEGGRHLDGELAVKFIECLGIYPAGSIVEMSNEEVALVIEVNPRQKLKPKVIMLLDQDKNPQSHRIVDLAKLDLDPFGQPYRIKAILKNGTYNLDIRQYHERGLVQKAAAL
ncbi:HD-GYP domain-containing protein [Methylocaldum sp.]|uniref:HD-GYP domain-containing protein n=1 Tax=Methylocaldum sp. TaxID=1969727 RepID=UPI002D69A29A|nr:HD-GYP domain-containing protein [Methylocaldum sp.]HYE35459.1 HD-GYP domain-containing protein [Methylocaldum sp.]